MTDDFGKHGDLSPESIERIGDLMDGGLDDIKWVIGMIRTMPHLPEKSADLRDQYREIADTARKLAALIEADPTHAVNYVRELRQVADDYDSDADDADPEGKPQPRNAAHYALAYYLVSDAALYGRLEIEPRINNDSDFANLYRVCCKEAGLMVQKNVTPYLRDAIEKVNQEINSMKQRENLQEVIRQMVSDAFENNKK